MANICCDDVIFYTEGNPEGLYDLWEDLETYIILNQNPDLCWIGNLFSHKKIEENPEEPHYIETIRGVGYRFRA
jgi:hypothetical protein